MTPRFEARHRRVGVIVFPLLCGLLLAGCIGRSPQVRHFTLGTQHRLPAAQRAPTLAVLIGPVRLPDYLDRSQIVRRSGRGEIQLDEFNRWLGGFESVLTTAVSNQVRRQLGSARVVGYPSKAPFALDYSVRIHVDDWVVEESGALKLSVRWAITTTDQNAAPVLGGYESEMATAGSSVEALVDAHDRAIAEFAGRLADELVEVSSSP